MPEDTEQLTDADDETEGQLAAADADSKTEGEAGQRGDDATKATGTAEDYLEVVVRGETRKVSKKDAAGYVSKGLGFEENQRRLKEERQKFDEERHQVKGHADVGRDIVAIAEKDPQVRQFLLERIAAYQQAQPPRDPRVDALLEKQERVELTGLVPQWLGRELDSAEDLDTVREAYPGLALRDAYFLAHRSEILTHAAKATEKRTLTKLEESRKTAGPQKAGGGGSKGQTTEEEFWGEAQEALLEAMKL
jgi:hypothetical protein